MDSHHLSSPGRTSEVTVGEFAPNANGHREDHHAHSVQFYTDDASLLTGLSRFIGTALGAGDAAIVIATPVHRNELAKRLKSRGLNLANATKQGRYVALDAAETLSKFMVDGKLDAARFSEVIGGVLSRVMAAGEGRPLRLVAFGEMVALLWAEGKTEAAIQLEQFWNDLAKTHTFFLHCAYPLKGFYREEHGEPFQRICAEHSRVIPDESYTALTTEEERLRTISQLQQKAQALEAEVAERKEMQKALGRRESELSDLLENAVEGVQQVGPDQRIRWANRALLKLLGYQASEYVNHHLAEFHVHSHVFDEFWQKLMASQDIYDFPAELRCKDGSTKNVLIYSNGLWDDGHFVHTRCFVRDVTEQKQMEEALKKAHEELEMRVVERTSELARANAGLKISENSLRQLSGLLLRVQDEERRRLARDLHDSTAQAFTALSLNLAAAFQYINPADQPNVANALSDSMTLADEACREIRTFSYLLHPPLLDDAGLRHALRYFVEGFCQRTKIKVDLEVAPELDRLSPDQETALFRIVQECLANIHRHAESSRADIVLALDSGEIILKVRDYGKGLPAPACGCENGDAVTLGVGIRGMRERIRQLGGGMEIGAASPGTRVRVILPLTAVVMQ